MAGKTKAARALDKKLALDNLNRLAGGTVAVLVWPVKPPSAEDQEMQEDWLRDGHIKRIHRVRVFCSALCILRSQCFEYQTFETTEEQNRDDDLTYIPRGTWPLTRYEVRRHYKADVAHFRCAFCKGPLRSTLTPLKKRRRCWSPGGRRRR